MQNDLKLARRLLMRTAHAIRNDAPANGSMSVALTISWDVQRFRNDLHAGFVRFEYTKKDGTQRVALGTLSTHLIPADKMPEHSVDYVSHTPAYIVTYYDLDRDAWRSFRADRFIDTIKAWPVN